MSHPPPDLHFYLLGELRITYQGAPVVRPPQRAYSLLAALLLRPRPQRRGRLAQWLFPQLAEAEGRRRLSDLLWLLRRALPMLPLEMDANEIVLSAALRWLDVEALRQAMHSQRAEDWLAALDLYGGELLAGMSGEWLQVERENLHSQFVRFLHRAGRIPLTTREAEILTPLAERLAREEPYDEAAVRALMRAYSLTAGRGKALAVYEQFAARAAAELGLEPEAETQQLAQELRGRASPPVEAPGWVLSPPHAGGVDAAQSALQRGDFKTVRAWLSQRPEPTSAQPDAVRRIRFDLAMLDEDEAGAADSLAGQRLDDPAWLWRSAELGLARGDLDTAYQQAAEALLLAHQSQAHSAELDTLLILARLHEARGRSMQALNIINKVILLAEQNRAPASLAEAHYRRGCILTHHSRYDDAAHALYEAELLARRHGLKRHLAHIFNRLSQIQAESGDLMQARALLERALNLWRELGLPAQEAHSLYNLGLLQAQMGQAVECQNLIRQAAEIHRRADNRLGLAAADYALAFAAAAQDDALIPQAIRLLEQRALPAFRALRRRDWEAPAMALLAELFFLDDRHEASLQAALQAQAWLDELDELSAWPLVFVIRGLAQLALNQLGLAQAAVAQAMLAVAQGSAAVEDTPLVYYAQAMLQTALGRETEATYSLKLAYEALLKQAEQLAEESARQALCRRDPLTRRLMQAAYQRGLVPLPSGAVTRWLAAEHGAGPVMVHWTVDAGASDLALLRARGAAALRRERLTRLLQAAQAQGGAPTVAQLADVLNVSPRTIQRDQAMLRRGQG